MVKLQRRVKNHIIRMVFRLTYLHLLVASCCLLGVSCSEKTEIPGGDPDEYNVIYMSKAARSLNVVTLQMVDSVQLISFGASFGGFGFPSEDIHIQFEVDEDLVDTYNNLNETNYLILPAESYHLNKSSAVIPAGEVSTVPLYIEINPQAKLEAFKTYLLPVSIRDTDSKYLINNDLKTTYFLVQTILEFDNFPKYDRSEWTIWGLSTEEPNESPSNGGLGISTFDGNIDTFWHSKWVGGIVGPPHWIAIDMRESKTVHGLSILNRQKDQVGKPKDIIIALSNDGTDWIEVYETQLENVKTEQKFFVNDMRNARYFRITILSSYGDVRYAHIAEINVF